MIEYIRMAEARTQPNGPIVLHLSPKDYSCKEFGLQVDEAKHLWHRLGIAISQANKNKKVN